ncbi:MAG TPA: amino acid adenylation domain-containing protein, partial [Mucilaginibacter sp.]
SIRDLFIHPGIALLAAHIDSQTKGLLFPAIEAVSPRPEKIPLSFSQERLWFIDRLEGSVHYHVPAALRLKGWINKNALTYAFKNIINRHEVLRTVFEESGGNVSQVLMEKDSWQLSVTDGIKYTHDTDAIQASIKQIINTPFDLTKDYTLRADLISLGASEHILVVVLHHIASDGWSMSVLVKELVELYNAKVDGRPAKLASLPFQYADYSIWQQSWLQGEVLDEKLTYWKQKLQDISPLELPTDHVRPAIQRKQGALTGFKIDKRLKTQIDLLSQAQSVTPYMTLLAAFKMLLYRYSGQEDIVVGTGIAGRQQQELEGLIGFFVNTLALRTQVKGDAPFTTLLQAIRTTTLEAYEHQEVPFEKVVDSIVKERDLSRNPLFQVMFMLQNIPEVPELRLGAMDISMYNFEHITSKFDITFTITEVPDGLEVVVEYDTDLYQPGTLERMMRHYENLLYSVVSDPETQIGQLVMLSQEEEKTLLQEFNIAGNGYSWNKSLVDLFEEQVLAGPDKIAIVFEGEELKYGELNRRSNQLARYLQEKGVTADVLVPICLERSPEMVIGILGILKAGGAYVPIDPGYPAERIKYMLEDTRAKVVLSSKSSSAKLTEVSNDLGILALDGEEKAVRKQSDDNLETVIRPGDLAYVIYTSGSTGKPKGVMVGHISLLNYLLNSKTGYINGDEALSGSFIHLSCTFDASLTAMFMPILSGKSIVLSSKNAAEVFEDVNLWKYAPYDFIKITPAHLELIHSKLRDTDGKMLTAKLVIGGEALHASHFSNLIEDGIDIEIINEYGPTEATVGCSTYSFYPVTDKEKITKGISIGKPIDNTQIYILDGASELVAIGVGGEICIAGAGLSQGYLNLAELTAERFVNNPFSKQEGARLYKTGDMGRWLPDGNIEYLGRKDDQVKVRGYRIELGEIENAINGSDQVNRAVVLAKEDSRNDKRLLSYYVPDWQFVRAEEYKHYRQQVAVWKELYEIEYGQTEDATDVDEEFNLIGWNDSFTGSAIPEEQMREWLDDIVSLILSEKPGCVLEIGCGTGLIFYQLAGKVEKYLGTDLSRSSIKQITSRINKGLRGYGPVDLWVSPAHEVNLPEGEQVDTILLNSMVQYFPGEGYMDEVIARSISLLNGKGRIIIGDVRDNRLLEMFKLRLQMQKLQSSSNIQELVWAAEQEVLKEEELCFSPEYFYRLQSLYPQITYVDIAWKQGLFINELTLYRYNVVIYVGVDMSVINPKWENWQHINRQSILNQVNNGSKIIAIKDAPNPRLWKERLISNVLKQKTSGTLGDLSEVIEYEDKETLSIREILKVAETNGYQCHLLLDEDPFKVNVLIEKTGSVRFIGSVYAVDGKIQRDFYTNIPLFNDISAALKKDIRIFLQQSLPDYMIPQDFIAIKELPLTGNGKIDRRFLSQREDVILRNTLNYQPAATVMQQKLVSIWQELLNIERIGIHDNFFDLGGHSLLATRLVSAIRKRLEIEVAIKDVFNNPTIALLSACLEVQTQGLLFPSVEVYPRPEHIPLSFSQERLWFIDRLEGSVQYHIPAVLRLKGSLNFEALGQTLR